MWDTLNALVSLCQEEKLYLELVGALQEKALLTEDLPERAQILAQAAQLLSDELSQDGEAIELWERVLDLEIRTKFRCSRDGAKSRRQCL